MPTLREFTIVFDADGKPMVVLMNIISVRSDKAIT